jgi:uncharacterized protein YndB with AHSA1/START domain
MSEVQKNSCVQVVVDAPTSAVWEVVSDVTRVGEWSHECRSARWLGDATRPVPGARFRGANRAGPWRWSRTCEIVSVDPPHEIVWRTVSTALFPDSCEWRVQLESAGGGTRIIQSFRVLRLPPRLLERVYSTLIPTHQNRDAELAEDLARIGPVARRGVPT